MLVRTLNFSTGWTLEVSQIFGFGPYFQPTRYVSRACNHCCLEPRIQLYLYVIIRSPGDSNCKVWLIDSAISLLNTIINQQLFIFPFSVHSWTKRIWRPLHSSSLSCRYQPCFWIYQCYRSVSLRRWAILHQHSLFTPNDSSIYGQHGKKYVSNATIQKSGEVDWKMPDSSVTKDVPIIWFPKGLQFFFL